MATATITSTTRPIQAYYEQLKIYSAQGVNYESALKTAFQGLLAETAKAHHWSLTPELPMKVHGRLIRPDGTLRDDDWLLPRGYWEAKDTDDNLNDEIRKKIDIGYPLSNTIFEDSRRGVLYQNGKEASRVDLSQPAELADLLNRFYGHTERDHEGFEQAVVAFKERVPELAAKMLAKIHEAHAENEEFQAAFGSFHRLCRRSLNHNIREAAVDEMLVQHLLTERIFDEVFQDQDFVRRNVIAVEIEKVIVALVSRSFNRHEFLKSIEPLYRAIEAAARTIGDFGEKQYFLNTVYERFFQGYSVKLADTHGIVYTPQAIVEFMCDGVAGALKDEFGTSLGSPDVNILDPCTGTGNFIVSLLRRISPRDVHRAYRKQLFANEVMLLPYYIASLNIEHEFYELTGDYEAFEGMCFADTLDIADGGQRTMTFMTEENAARVERQKKTPITVVIGNPPYNANQINENDNNKNRKYKIIDALVKSTYVKSSKATLRNKLYDPYVKFFRWSTDRLRGRPGIVCLVTNNGFLDGRAFDGFRAHLRRDFDRIYHFNLKGNARTTGERRKREGGNIFNDMIRAGVGITFLIRTGKGGPCELSYYAVPDYWGAEEKTQHLGSFAKLSDVPWRKLSPDRDHNWLTEEDADDFRDLPPLGLKGHDSIFKVHSTGAKSNRDDVVYDFDPVALSCRAERFITDYNGEVDRYKRAGGGKNIDEFVDPSRVKWSSTLKRHLACGRLAEFDPRKIRRCLYRPFTKRYVYYDAILNDRPGLFRDVLPTPDSEKENLVICCTNHLQIGFVVIMTNLIANEAVGGRAGQCFPLYVYGDTGNERRDNITNWAMSRFRDRYGDDRISKIDIFHYIYGVLHHPAYREKYSANLRRDLPRVPFMNDFWLFSAAGKGLAKLHVGFEEVEPWPLEWIYKKDVRRSFRVDKMRFSRDKTSLVVNESLTLGAIPPEVFRYRLGNRSALEWVVEQHRIFEDEGTGVYSNPNRSGEPEYIVRLVEQVVRVSVETVRIIDGLPPG